MRHTSKTMRSANKVGGAGQRRKKRRHATPRAEERPRVEERRVELPAVSHTNTNVIAEPVFGQAPVNCSCTHNSHVYHAYDSDGRFIAIDTDEWAPRR